MAIITQEPAPHFFFKSGAFSPIDYFKIDILKTAGSMGMYEVNTNPLVVMHDYERFLQYYYRTPDLLVALCAFVLRKGQTAPVVAALYGHQKATFITGTATSTGKVLQYKLMASEPGSRVDYCTGAGAFNLPALHRPEDILDKGIASWALTTILPQTYCLLPTSA